MSRWFSKIVYIRGENFKIFTGLVSSTWKTSVREAHSLLLRFSSLCLNLSAHSCGRCFSSTVLRVSEFGFHFLLYQNFYEWLQHCLFPCLQNDLFSKEEEEKKRCYWALAFCFYIWEKRISTLIVCLLVMTCLNNKIIPSSFSIFPHSRTSPCCNCLKFKCSKELSYQFSISFNEDTLSVDLL